MATFHDHIKQAQNNLNFLCQINDTSNDHWDWQVTVCFYTAVHLANAHLADKANLHYHTHTDTINALNPTKHILLGFEFSELEYLAYVKLKNLSRRSRYLCIDGNKITPDTEGIAYLTYDKHLYKAIRYLENILKFIHDGYNIIFPIMEIDCMDLKNGASLQYFRYKQKRTLDTVR